MGKVFHDLILVDGVKEGKKDFIGNDNGKVINRKRSECEATVEGKMDGGEKREKQNITSTEMIKMTDKKDSDNLKLLNSIFIESCNSMMLGIDVSIKMVEIAEKTNYYTKVVRADLSEALKMFEMDCDRMDNNYDDNYNHNNNNNFDYYDNNNNNNNNNNSYNNNAPHRVKSLNLIIAADTFIYVGALGFVFRQIKLCLEKNGYFLFSIEDLDRSPMRVNDKNLSIITQVDKVKYPSMEMLSVYNLYYNKNNKCIDHEDNNHINSKRINDSISVKIEKNDDEIEGKISHLEIEELRIIDFEPVGAVPGWGGELLKSARFAHSNSYIEILAHIHGFQIVKSKSVILRTEETIPLYGRLYVLESI